MNILTHPIGSEYPMKKFYLFKILNSLKSYPEHNKIHRTYVYPCNIYPELKKLFQEENK